jgi:C4-dicarboxylate transporter DctQ subunit
MKGKSMDSVVKSAVGWVQRRGENVIAALLGIMFTAFMIQIVFRYFLNLPTGWTTELTLVSWLWLVLFGTAFALKEKDEIRFDIFTSAAGPRTRRVMTAIISVAIVALYGASLPATVKYVSFMAIEKSSYLNIPLNWLYSIFVIFVVAIIARYLWILWEALRGGDAEAPGTDEESPAP